MRNLKFVFCTILLSVLPALSQTVSAGDDHGAHLVAEKLVSRVTKVCSGHLTTVTGMQYDEGASVKYKTEGFYPASTAEKLNNPKFLGSITYDIKVKSSAYRVLGEIDAVKNLDEPAGEWRDTMLEEERIRDPNGILSLKDLAYLKVDVFERYVVPKVRLRFGGSHFSSFANSVETEDDLLNEGVEYYLAHPEFNWATINCEDMKLSDVASAKLFVHEGDTASLDKMLTGKRIQFDGGPIITSEQYRAILHSRMAQADSALVEPDVSAPTATSNVKEAGEMEKLIHNGSVMALYRFPAAETSPNVIRVEIRYLARSSGMVQQNVVKDTLLFDGIEKDGELSGNTRSFSKKCGTPLQYSAVGVKTGEDKIVLQAEKPIRKNCQLTGEFESEKLIFSRSK